MPTRRPELEPDEDLDETFEPTRTSLREEAEAYTALAEQLAKGKHGALPDPPFDAELREAIVDAQRFRKNARTRQIRRVAQLLRGAGALVELHEALEGKTAAARAKQAREHAAEVWRTRLLEQQDAGLAAFMAEHPDADRQRLRQLIRQASRTPADARSKRAATSLLRAVRALLEGPCGADEPEAGSADDEAV